MRYIVIGDIHGCLTELNTLLEKVNLQDDDIVLPVGDLVDRGPDSVGVIRRIRQLAISHPGSLSIAGNHEDSALKGRIKVLKGQPWVKHLDWVYKMSDDDWAYLESMPLLYRIPDSNFLLVHGGVFPRFFEAHGSVGDVPQKWRKGGGKKMDRMRRFLRVRSVDSIGNMVSLYDIKPEHSHWADVYQGQEGFILYGHDAQQSGEVRRSTHALGLDTACCFGGRLTAAIIQGGELVDLISVPAKQAYAKYLSLEEMIQQRQT